jgi:hypothetical protein
MSKPKLFGWVLLATLALVGTCAVFVWSADPVSQRESLEAERPDMRAKLCAPEVAVFAAQVSSVTVSDLETSPEAVRAYVRPKAWAELDLREREGLALWLAWCMAPAEPPWALVYLLDANTGRELAEWDAWRGYEGAE